MTWRVAGLRDNVSFKPCSAPCLAGAARRPLRDCLDLGSKHIDPALVGILFMTEITVGGITAALWAGEPFGPRELIGVVLITGAALVDSIWDFWQARLAAAAGAVERTRTSTVLPTSTSS